MGRHAAAFILLTLLASGAAPASAQTNQSVDNQTNVSAPTLVTGDRLLDLSSVGADARRDLSGIASFPGTLQSAVNSGEIVNTSDLSQPSLPVFARGTGASLSVSAVGARASLAARSLDRTDRTSAGVATRQVVVTATNSGSVVNSGALGGSLVMAGTGSQASISASGAIASVDNQFVSSNGIPTSAIFLPGNPLVFQQSAANSGSVANVFPLGNQVIAATDMSGPGASLTASASGAIGTFGVTAIDAIAQGPTQLFVTFLSNATALVTQDVQNSGSIRMCCLLSLQQGPTFLVLSGSGASVSMSAVGALASMSTLSIAPREDAIVNSIAVRTGLPGGAAAITQSALNSGAVSTGDSATPDLRGGVSLGAITGTGATVSTSATGAAAVATLAAIGLPGVRSTFTAYALLTSFSQTAVNTASASVRTGSEAAPILVSTPGLTGIGASAGAAATGAVASVSTALIGFTGTFVPMSFASAGTSSNLAQVASSASPVALFATNVDPASPGGSTPFVAALGTSVFLTATGAATSLANLSIGSSVASSSSASGLPSGISQSATNGTGSAAAPITTVGSIAAFSIGGTGASVAIGSMGASTSIATTSIGDTGVSPNYGAVGPISQVAVNAGSSPVRTNGTITTSSLGIAANAAVFATGANAGISYRSLR